MSNLMCKVNCIDHIYLDKISTCDACKWFALADETNDIVHQILDIDGIVLTPIQIKLGIEKTRNAFISIGIMTYKQQKIYLYCNHCTKRVKIELYIISLEKQLPI